MNNPLPNAIGKLAFIKRDLGAQPIKGTAPIHLALGDLVVVLGTMAGKPAYPAYHSQNTDSRYKVLPASNKDCRECSVHHLDLWPIYDQNSLAGKSFCVTGTLSQPREFYIKIIQAHGGVWKSAVTKGLDYLVLADPKASSTKAQSARRLGTTCISEQQLTKMLHNGIT